MSDPQTVVAIDDRNSVPFQLVRQAERRGDKPFVRFARGGVSIGYGELTAWAEAGSTRLVRGGFERGTMAALLLPNGPEFVAAWFACLFAGCVDVPINPEYRKATLLFALQTSDAQIVFTDADGLLHLADPEVAVYLDRLRLVVLCGPRTHEALDALAAVTARTRLVPLDELIAPGASEGVWRRVRATECASIRFTSGTTGSAKGIMHSHLHMLGKAMVINRILEAETDDVLYSPFPLHHNMTSINGLMGVLQLGGTIVCATRFSASQYWPDVRDCGATLGHILPPLVPMLMAQPPSAADRDHALRAIWVAPGSRAFSERFGARLVQGYALSEVGAIAFRRDGGIEGSTVCGPIASDMDVRIVDDIDRPLAAGVAGEITVRPRHPHRMTLGYYGNLPATQRAFRNLWYHTGDLGMVDADGQLHFLGRLGDTIRRRGVNMSSEQIEAEILRHAGIESCAAVGVPSPLGDQDIHALVVFMPGPPDAERRIADLIRFLGERLPREYVPRFFEIAPELPKTITGKVRKADVAKWVGRGPVFDRESGRWDRPPHPVS